MEKFSNSHQQDLSSRNESHWLDELENQIKEHHQQKASRSYLDNLVGIAYSKDEESLQALEHLEARCKSMAAPYLRITDNAMHHPLMNGHEIVSPTIVELRNKISLDRAVLSYRNGLNKCVENILTTGALFLKIGTVVGLGAGSTIYALAEMKPSDSLKDQAIELGRGVFKETAFASAPLVLGRVGHIGLSKILLPSIEAGRLNGFACLVSRPASELPEQISHQLPASPAEVFNIVSQQLSQHSPVNLKGPIAIAEYNAQLAKAEKASLYQKTYQYMFARSHLIFLEEVNHGFCQEIAKDIGYSWQTSPANSLEQAVAFLVHPRLKVLGKPEIFDQITNIDKTPDLRPAFLIHLKDTVSGAQFDSVAVHLKSMRGVNSKSVRYEQTTRLASLFGKTPTLVGGDWNFCINKHWQEMTPLEKAGFRLINPESTKPTQDWGERLDGFMQRNVPNQFSNFETFNFWRYLHGRSFSDHGLVTMNMDIK